MNTVLFGVEPICTTFSDKTVPIPTDRVDRQFKASAPNRLRIHVFQITKTEDLEGHQSRHFSPRQSPVADDRHQQQAPRLRSGPIEASCSGAVTLHTRGFRRLPLLENSLPNRHAAGLGRQQQTIQLVVCHAIEQ
mgnify:FL=1|uniref:hypothetical protein n=1 Tax=Rhizobium sp. PDO1-076 TaxID=1125979 RepID=UPI0011471DA5|nr:hypothetical protein [Rhizobium sp. PDO1-076]